MDSAPVCSDDVSRARGKGLQAGFYDGGHVGMVGCFVHRSFFSNAEERLDQIANFQFAYGIDACSEISSRNVCFGGVDNVDSFP